MAATPFTGSKPLPCRLRSKWAARATLEIGGSAVSSAQDVADAIREAGRLNRRALLLRIKSGNDTPRFVAIQLRRG
jgi:hypothetical protein